MGREGMTLSELEKTRPAKISVPEAAKIMGVTPQFLRLGLQQGKYSFGEAVKMKHWRYNINTERFICYMRAKDLQLAVG